MTIRGREEALKLKALKLKRNEEKTQQGGGKTPQQKEISK
jgi:hypothetical protein